PAVHTDKIRLYITKGTATGVTNDNQARVFEIEVWEHDPNPYVPETDPIYVYGIEVMPANRIAKLDAGQSLNFSAAVLPSDADDSSITWHVVGADGMPTDLASITQVGV